MEKKINRLGKCIFLSGAVLASAMLAGCSQEAGSVLRGFNGSGDDVQVSVSFADADKASSRAADGLDTSAGGFGNESAGVCIKADNQDANNLSSYTAFSYAVASGGKSVTAPNEGPKFPSGVNSVNVYGWYPYNNGNASFTVQSNQQSSDNYCQSDLMLANRAACTRNASTGVVEQAASLTFRHVLSKVKVNLSLGANVTVSGVALKGILPTVAINESDPASLTVGSASGSSTDITLLSGGSLTSASPAADLTLCGVFPGQEKSGALLAVTASYNGGSAQTITYNLESAKTFAGGKEYVMNISLEGTDITTGTVSIGDWDTPNGTVNIGHGALALSTYTVDDLVAGGSAGTVTVSDNNVTNVTVASAHPDIATASATGTTVTITPLAEGTTQLIVSAEKNGMKLFGVIDVTVTEATLTLASVKANWNDEYLGRYVTADGTVTETYDAETSIGRIAYYNADRVDVNDASYKILVLALTSVNDKQWKTANTAEIHLINSETAMHGLYATTMLASNDYPAFQAASNYSASKPTGSSIWFLPSKGQWNAMQTVAMMDGYGKLPSEGSFWSATEVDGNAANAWVFGTSTGSMSWLDGYSKNMSVFKVRPCFAY